MPSSHLPVRRLEALRAPELTPDALHRFHAAALDAVLWDHDLGRVAELTGEAIGAPVAIVLPHLQIAAVAPPGDPALAAAVAAHVADRLRGRPARVPERVWAEAPIARRGEPLGTVMVLDGAPGPHPTAVADVLAVAAGVALAHVAQVELRAAVEQELQGSLLEQLRGSEPLDPQLLVQRAARLGCDLSRGAVGLCMRCEPGAERRALTLIRQELRGALAEVVDGRLVALLPLDDGPDGRRRVEALVRRLRPLGPCGASRHHPAAGELRQALEEAELVLDVHALADGPVDLDTAMSGTYRLLFRLLASHPAEVTALYEGTVAALVQYDEHHRTDLVATLETYLELNGNMNATAAKVYAHRHTVAYRLDRIRELTGLDPADGEHRERLGLGLKAHRLLRRDATRP
jgi:hypothetical protein